MAWTKFLDMNSGGGSKLEWEEIYIEAPEDIAVRVFAAKFGRQADNVTCACCGEDYSVSQHKSLEEATAYSRGDTGQGYKKFISLEDFVLDSDFKFVYKEQILPIEEVTPLVRQVYHEEYY